MGMEKRGPVPRFHQNWAEMSRNSEMLIRAPGAHAAIARLPRDSTGDHAGGFYGLARIPSGLAPDENRPNARVGAA